MIHEVILSPERFEQLLCRKRFEVLRDDRKFCTGQYILFCDGYEGTPHRELLARITYVLSSDRCQEGIREGYSVVGFKVIKDDRR